MWCGATGTAASGPGAADRSGKPGRVRKAGRDRLLINDGKAAKPDRTVLDRRKMIQGLEP